MKAPSMTPSKYTSDYFDGLNIPCIVKSDRLRRKYSELKPFHGQRYFVMDEPADDENRQVCSEVSRDKVRNIMIIK